MWVNVVNCENLVDSGLILFQAKDVRNKAVLGTQCVRVSFSTFRLPDDSRRFCNSNRYFTSFPFPFFFSNLSSEKRSGAHFCTDCEILEVDWVRFLWNTWNFLGIPFFRRLMWLLKLCCRGKCLLFYVFIEREYLLLWNFPRFLWFFHDI